MLYLLHSKSFAKFEDMELLRTQPDHVKAQICLQSRYHHA